MAKRHPILEAKNLYYRYPESENDVLRGIQLSLNPGQITCLMGRSGMGKSTLIHALSGHLQLQSGEVQVDGQVLKGPEDQLVPGHPDIAVAFQQEGWMPNRSVADNLAFPIRLWEPHFIEERIDQLLRLTGLEQYKESLPEQLSGGQKQRLVMAMALAPEPLILLLDEPFSQVDYPEKRSLMEAIRKTARQEEVAVLFVVHEPRDALQLADHLVVLEQGQILEQGPPEQLYHKPKHLETAEITGPLTALKEQSYIRPEHLILKKSTQGKGHQIVQRFFSYPWVRYVLSKAGGDLEVLSLRRDWQEGQYVELAFQEEDLLRFEHEKITGQEDFTP